MNDLDVTYYLRLPPPVTSMHLIINPLALGIEGSHWGIDKMLLICWLPQNPLCTSAEVTVPEDYVIRVLLVPSHREG